MKGFGLKYKIIMELIIQNLNKRLKINRTLKEKDEKDFKTLKYSFYYLDL